MYWSTTLALFLVVCALHFWRLGGEPQGFHADEASIAYNAYSILQTGADEYGTRWPLFFRSFDTYVDPVDVYATVPFVWAFGLHQWNARLPVALFYLLAGVAFFILLRVWRMGPWFALGGAFVLSIVPWLFPSGRVVSLAAHFAGLCGLIAGLALADSALRRQSTGQAVLAGVVWAFTFYTHQSIYAVVVLLAVGCGIVLWRPLLRRWKTVVVMLVAAFIASAPMLISSLRFEKAPLARFQALGVFRDGDPLKDVAIKVANHYLDYFSVPFLFLSGDNEPRHHTGRCGELYWCLAPLILAGVYIAIRYWRRQPRYRVILVGLLVSPISAVLTVDRSHSTRSLYAVLFWLLLAVIGARALWRHRRVGRKLLLLAVVVGLAESSLYFVDYFGSYQSRIRSLFGTDLTKSIQYSFDHVESNQLLYVSATIGGPNYLWLNRDLKPFFYVYFLFYGRIDPATYQRGGFSQTIVRPYLERIDGSGLLLRCNLYLGRTQLTPIPNPEYLPVTAKLLATFQEYGPFEYQVFEVQP
jgi:4-amino-4-deoxy-L-arabinose transferase-like glycosyltransferase